MKLEDETVWLTQQQMPDAVKTYIGSKDIREVDKDLKFNRYHLEKAYVFSKGNIEKDGCVCKEEKIRLGKNMKNIELKKQLYAIFEAEGAVLYGVGDMSEFVNDELNVGVSVAVPVPASIVKGKGRSF